MPRWLIVVLLIGVSALATCGVAFGAGAWWFNKNKAGLVAQGLEAKNEGEAFGQQHQDRECVGEVLGRLTPQSSFTEEIRLRLFLASCVKAAERAPGYCEAVPLPSAVLKVSAWALDTCGRAGRGTDQPCTRVVQGAIDGCHPRTDPSTH